MTVFRTLLITGFAALLGACASPGPQPGSVQRLTPEQLARIAPTPNPAIPLSEIMALSKAGTPPEAIIKRLADTGTVHVLSASQIINLATHGVDQKVIDALVEAQERSRQTTLVTQLADSTRRKRNASNSSASASGRHSATTTIRSGTPIGRARILATASATTAGIGAGEALQQPSAPASSPKSRTLRSKRFS